MRFRLTDSEMHAILSKEYQVHLRLYQPDSNDVQVIDASIAGMLRLCLRKSDRALHVHRPQR
jgi:hypothetical protein